MTYRWSKDVESLKLDEDWLLINTQTFTLTKLEDLGGFIWSNLCESISRTQVIERVLDEYNAAKEQVVQDVDYFLNHLIQLNLLEISNSENSVSQI
jgi:hypothetical protein